jgi:hypothetical protein
VVTIGHAVKLENRNAPVPRLIRGALKVVQRPIWPRVAGGRNQQRMILAWFVGEAASPLVGMFRCAPRRAKRNPSSFNTGSALV